MKTRFLRVLVIGSFAIFHVLTKFLVLHLDVFCIYVWIVQIKHTFVNRYFFLFRFNYSSQSWQSKFCSMVMYGLHIVSKVDNLLERWFNTIDLIVDDLPMVH